MSQLALDHRLNTAVFSSCETYRYTLTREIGGIAPLVSIGLNPSTATAEIDDPTIRKDVGFAKRWGLGRVVKLNAFAFRATDPQDMKRAATRGVDIVGPENDFWIAALLCEARLAHGRVVVSWGNHITHERQRRIAQLIADCNVEAMCLGVNKNGTPMHELYIPYEREPRPWSCP